MSWISVRGGFKLIEIRLMAEILHHLGCRNPKNNGINYLSTGAGFQPSTVVYVSMRSNHFTIRWTL